MSESMPQSNEAQNEVDETPIDWDAIRQLPLIPVPEEMPPHLPRLDLA